MSSTYDFPGSADRSYSDIELMPCPLCQSTNVTPGVCYVEFKPNEPAVRCADCGCRATKQAWQSRASLQPATPTAGCGTPGCTDPNCQYGKDEDESYERGFKAGYEVATININGVAQCAWRPIETAPENHLPVQVYGLCGQLVAFRDVNWIWWAFPNGEDPLNYTPTHWKPLGPSPIPSTDRGGEA